MLRKDIKKLVLFHIVLEEIKRFEQDFTRFGFLTPWPYLFFRQLCNSQVKPSSESTFCVLNAASHHSNTLNTCSLSVSTDTLKKRFDQAKSEMSFNSAQIFIIVKIRFTHLLWKRTKKNYSYFVKTYMFYKIFLKHFQIEFEGRMI